MISAGRHRTALLLLTSAALGTFALGGCASGPRPPAAAGADASTSSATVDELAQGLEALASSKYADAERLLRRALAAPALPPEKKARALVGLGRTLLVTGRLEETARFVREHAQGAGAAHNELLALGAEALRRRGLLDEAEALLTSAERAADAAPPLPGQLEVELVRGEILLERGDRSGAGAALLSIIRAYNDEHLPPGAEAGRALAVVGRAAHLLRSPHDANDAFDEAEQASPGDVRTLLWRAELYLDKYDLAHADEVVTEALARAPHHPEALVAKAQVRLGQALDFDEAERLARAALAVDPTLAGAHFVLGGVALRDEEIARADEHVTRGLEHNRRDLDLLSLRATARFLADDEEGFERSVTEILGLNPEFTRLFQIVGEYADWEHRYDEIVRLMRRATRIDAEDGRARAQLGLNLIRAGQDAAGVVELRRSFEADPFNVRVFNTLELYEKIIPRDYEQVRSGRFAIRYPKRQRALLERYVPDLLEQAHRTMVGHYGFEPEGPLGIELYESREHFAVRTSGLPQTGIQGVCFGRTLATLSVPREPVNLGMTLWHELAHVFHIQLSRSRMPRWFTEGLAELETARQRPEWRRELDPQLFEALRTGRLPAVAQLSRAFTRAEHIEDVATAYYASSQIASHLVDEHGMDRLAAMLRAWGAGQGTPEVIRSVLGQAPEEVDASFRKALRGQLARFEGQFVPRRFRGSFEARREAAEAQPEDAEAQVAYALGLFDRGRAEDAEKRVRQVLGRSPDHPEARFALVRMLAAKKEWTAAEEELRRLAAGGHDGHEPRLLLARVALAREQKDAALKHLDLAHRFDPAAPEPLLRLAELYHQASDADGELEALRKLALLEEHSPHVHRRLLELLAQRGLWAEAVAAGEAAIWTNLGDSRMHVLFARALEATGAQERGLFELESATVCPVGAEERALAFQELSEAYARRGRRAQADRARREAERLLAGASQDAARAP